MNDATTTDSSKYSDPTSKEYQDRYASYGYKTLLIYAIDHNTLGRIKNQGLAFVSWAAAMQWVEGITRRGADKVGYSIADFYTVTLNKA